MPRTAGWFDELFGTLDEPTQPRMRVDEPLHGIGALARGLGVPVRRIRRWIRNGQFPETPHWHEGDHPQAHHRLYAMRMIDAAVNIARDLGLDSKRRWDLAESDFGHRVSEAWYRTERAEAPWAGIRGWPDANPKNILDYSTPEKIRAAESARVGALQPRRDNRIIDMSTHEAREANNRGEPIYLQPSK